MAVGPAGTVNTNVPPQNYGDVSQEQVEDFKEAVSHSTTSSNAPGMQSSKGEHTPEHSQDTPKSLPFVLATRPPINLGSPTVKQGAPLYDTQGKGSKAGSETGGIPNDPHSSENATKPERVADKDQPNTRTRTTGIGAGPTSNPVRVLPHIHLEDHREPPRRVTMQDDCNFYKGKADRRASHRHLVHRQQAAELVWAQLRRFAEGREGGGRQSRRPALVSSPGVSVRRQDVVSEGARVHLAQRSG
jgi:hypothetical protein